MPRKPRKGDVAADEAVYGAIRRAMHMGRLAPGTKLQEPALARVLGVSRERVRKALHRLVHEGWLTAIPNRGTFVPSLTVEEMREIYDVRSMLEAAIVRRLSEGHSAAAAKRLKAHVAEEKAATRRGPSRRRCRPCGSRSPIRCRTRTGRGHEGCRPSPWSGPCGRSTNAGRG
jgi:DNA-binding GntR family transcriptional regulator